MNFPDSLNYTPEHTWIRTEADGTLTVGITDHAQGELGDIVFVELPEVGRTVAAGEQCALVESVKTASEIYAPVSGEILSVNAGTHATPERINSAPYDAWLFQMRPRTQEDVKALWDAPTYRKSIGA